MGNINAAHLKTNNQYVAASNPGLPNYIFIIFFPSKQS